MVFYPDEIVGGKKLYFEIAICVEMDVKSLYMLHYIINKILIIFLFLI